jgi:hypothetical protein
MAEHNVNIEALQEQSYSDQGVGADHSFADSPKFCRYGGSDNPGLSEHSNVVDFPSAGHHGADAGHATSGAAQRSHVKTSSGRKTRKNKGGRPRKYQHKLTEKAAENIYRKCLDPKHPSYKDYGPEYLCDRWRSASDPKYMIYLDLLDTPGIGRRPSKYHTADRYPDPHGQYGPNNLRWATPKQQAQNRRTPAHTKRTVDQMANAWVEACWRYQGHRAKLASHPERQMLATIAHNVEHQGIAVLESDHRWQHMANDPVAAIWLVAAIWQDFSIQYALLHHRFAEAMDENGQEPHYLRNLIAKSPDVPELEFLYRHIEVLLNNDDWAEVNDLWERGECHLWTAHQHQPSHQGGAEIDPEHLEHML